MNRAVYQHGRYADLDVSWVDDNGLVDLTGRTITLEVFVFGGDVLFTKSAGFTIPALVDDEVQDPNLVVGWSQVADEELDALDPGQYVLHFTTDQDQEFYGELIVRLNAPNFGYCEESDLLLGDLIVAATVNKYDYINGAADEMNAMIGPRYQLPLNLSAAPAWVTFKLKTINQRLATGRLIQSLAVAHEDTSVNDYGQHLIDSAIKELEQIADGATSMPGLTLEPTSYRSTAPTVTNHDAISAVDQFEVMFMRPRRNVYPPVVWRPGANP